MRLSADNGRAEEFLFVFLFVVNIYWVWWLHDDGREREREHGHGEGGWAAAGVIVAAVCGRRRATGVLVAVARRAAGAVRAPDGPGGSPGPVCCRARRGW